MSLRRRAPGEPVRVLELRSVYGTGGGPEKTILLGAAGSDRARVQVTVCYIRDARDRVFSIDRRAAELQVDYVELQERHSLDPGVWSQLRRVVDERRIHVVHSHEYKSDLLGWLLARRTGITPLATAHGWTGHTSRERYLYYPANKRMLAHFPAVVAVSSEIRRELVAHGARPERIRVLLNGIDPEVFKRDPARGRDARARHGLPANGVTIGAVGRLEPQKRFDLLVRAFGRFLQTRADARLIIAGEGAERPSLEALIARLGLNGSCQLVGHVDDVVGFHHLLDVFVQSSDYEGTPNVVLEAMALETPVIATDVGGTAELCHPDVHGLIVASGSDEALAQALEGTFADVGARQSRVRAARRRVVDELSFARRLRTLEDLYETLAMGQAS